MTVSNSTSRADYTGNGVTVAFTIPFYFLDTSHVKVVRRTLSTGAEQTLGLTTDYTVAGAGVSTGGTLTMLTAPTVDQKITVLRNVPSSQLTHYVENDPFPAASHETALDKTTMLLQQVAEAAGRALASAETETPGPGPLPLAAARAGKFLGFDASGNPIALSGTGNDTALRTDLAASGGAALAGFKLSAVGAATQTIETVLRNIGAASIVQFMLPADIADIALATPLRDQTANIIAAFSSGKRIAGVVGNFRIDTGGILLPSGLQFVGAGSLQGGGTSFRFTKTDGTDCFVSDPTQFLSAVTFMGCEIVNVNNAAGTVGTGNAALYAAGSPGTGNAFKLYALTNNCKFKDVMVRNMGGSAWSIGRQTTNLADKTALQNVLFEQCFTVSCGGYAFDVNGFVVADWVMCDFNSSVTGHCRFQDGTTNQTGINFFGTWFEGTQAWTTLTAIEMLDTKGQVLNLIGCVFTNGRAGTSRAIKSTTSSCRLNVSGCTGFGWTSGHEDTPVGNTVPFDAPWNYAYQPTARQLILRGAGPVLDWFQDVGGTPDQRRFRAALSGNDLLWSARDDTGASVRNLFKVNHVTGAFVPAVDNTYDTGSVALRWATGYINTLRPGAGTVKWTSGAGTPEGVLVAPVGSLYTRTDGAAGTTLYVKETGSGNTGWVGK